MSFLAGNSQMVAARIDRASSRDDLGAAAGAIEPQVRMLRRQGVKVEVVAEIVSDLNRHLFAKLFAMTASPTIREHGCLIVMGSEGRGEQTMRTDQDNGLILAEPVDEAELRLSASPSPARSSASAFRPARANVMVVNPQWSKTLDEYRADFRRWLAMPDEHAHMNVAIFYDAEAVAGDGELLRSAKQALIEAMQRRASLCSRISRARRTRFPTPIGLFNNLVTSKGPGRRARSEKGRHFPDRARRALAGDRTRPAETGTAARIARLAECGALTVGLARELTQALRYLMTFASTGSSPPAASGSLVRPGELSTMERDLLRDAFQIVKQLREIVRRHFNLAMF